MKYLLALAFMTLVGCSGGVTVNPLQAAGCDVETVITSAFGGVIVNQCAGTDADACGQALLVALGNVNMCATPVPQPASLAGVAKWKTVGDINKGDLKPGGVSTEAVKPQGIVGGIVCPLAYSTIVGLVTGVVPKACGCTKNLDAGALGTALVAACISAVPI